MVNYLPDYTQYRHLIASFAICAESYLPLQMLIPKVDLFSNCFYLSMIYNVFSPYKPIIIQND